MPVLSEHEADKIISSANPYGEMRKVVTAMAYTNIDDPDDPPDANMEYLIHETTLRWLCQARYGLITAGIIWFPHDMWFWVWKRQILLRAWLRGV